MRTLTLAAVAASLSALLGMPALALQDTPPAQPAPEPAAPAATQDEPALQDAPRSPPAADAEDAIAKKRETDRLIAAFYNLLDISQNRLGGLTETEMMAVERLRADLEMFNIRWPEDQPMLALELQCSRWLGDRDRVDRLFGQLVEMNPQTPGMLIVWAEDIYGRNEYNRVLEVLELARHSPKDVHALGFLKAKALFAEHRFEEAQEALADLPESPQLKGPHLLEVAMLRRAIPEYITLWQKEQEIRAKEASADDLPVVTLETERGNIKLELFENEAPIAVANFITLAESGFYDNTTFHRVLPNHVTQGGDPNSKPGAGGVIGEGGPGYNIADEHTKPEARPHFSGSLGMAHSQAVNSGGSQFYICHEPKPDLNGKYTVFGRVIEGLDTARAMKLNEKLLRVTVERKRDHEYTFEKLTGQVPPATPTLKPVDPANIPQFQQPQKPAETPSESPAEPPAQNPAAAPGQR